MAKKRKSRTTKNQKTYKSTRVYPDNARADPLRSFLRLDVVPHYRLNEVRGQPYSPYEKPKAIRARWLEPSNHPTLQNQPVDLYKANKTVPQVIASTVCSRRQRRKEVIHAFNHAGKAGQKKPVRNLTSTISCKG